MTTDLELRALFNRAAARVAAQKTAPIASAFGRGFAAVVEGQKASVRKGTAEATPGFDIWPGLQVIAGDHVLYYELGSDRVIFFVLDRNALAGGSSGGGGSGGGGQAGIIYPTIAADENNWSPTGLATCSRILATVTGAARTITGFDAAGFVDGQEFALLAKTNNLVLAHNSALSSSGNRIGCPGAVSLTIRQGGGVGIIYDATLASAAPFRVIAP